MSKHRTIGTHALAFVIGIIVGAAWHPNCNLTTKPIEPSAPTVPDPASADSTGP